MPLRLSVPAFDCVSDIAPPMFKDSVVTDVASAPRNVTAPETVSAFGLESEKLRPAAPSSSWICTFATERAAMSLVVVKVAGLLPVWKKRSSAGPGRTAGLVAPPSVVVQLAVSDQLPPLVPFQK